MDRGVAIKLATYRVCRSLMEESQPECKENTETVHLVPISKLSTERRRRKLMNRPPLYESEYTMAAPSSSVESDSENEELANLLEDSEKDAQEEIADISGDEERPGMSTRNEPDIMVVHNEPDGGRMEDNKKSEDPDLKGWSVLEPITEVLNEVDPSIPRTNQPDDAQPDEDKIITELVQRTLSNLLQELPAEEDSQSVQGPDGQQAEVEVARFADSATQTDTETSEGQEAQEDKAEMKDEEVAEQVTETTEPGPKLQDSSLDQTSEPHVPKVVEFELEQQEAASDEKRDVQMNSELEDQSKESSCQVMVNIQTQTDADISDDPEEELKEHILDQQTQTDSSKLVKMSAGKAVEQDEQHDQLADQTQQSEPNRTEQSQVEFDQATQTDFEQYTEAQEHEPNKQHEHTVAAGELVTAQNVVPSSEHTVAAGELVLTQNVVPSSEHTDSCLPSSRSMTPFPLIPHHKVRPLTAPAIIINLPRLWLSERHETPTELPHHIDSDDEEESELSMAGSGPPSVMSGDASTDDADPAWEKKIFTQEFLRLPLQLRKTVLTKIAEKYSQMHDELDDIVAECLDLITGTSRPQEHQEERIEIVKSENVMVRKDVMDYVVRDDGYDTMSTTSDRKFTSRHTTRTTPLFEEGDQSPKPSSNTATEEPTEHEHAGDQKAISAKPVKDQKSASAREGKKAERSSPKPNAKKQSGQENLESESVKSARLKKKEPQKKDEKKAAKGTSQGRSSPKNEDNKDKRKNTKSPDSGKKNKKKEESSPRKSDLPRKKKSGKVKSAKSPRIRTPLPQISDNDTLAASTALTAYPDGLRIANRQVKYVAQGHHILLPAIHPGNANGHATAYAYT